MNILFLIVSLFILSFGAYAFMVVGIWLKTSVLSRLVMFHLPGVVGLVLTYLRWKGDFTGWHVILGVILSGILLLFWTGREFKKSYPSGRIHEVMQTENKKE